jgi:hypothetical protein
MIDLLRVRVAVIDLGTDRVEVKARVMLRMGN